MLQDEQGVEGVEGVVEHKSEYIAAVRLVTEMVCKSDVLVVPVQGGLGIRWRHVIRV
jgi:hypothetical protein